MYNDDDELEYENIDDEYYEEDDEEDVDADDSLSSRLGSPRSPFGGSGSPFSGRPSGTSPFGGSSSSPFSGRTSGGRPFGASSADEEDEDEDSDPRKSTFNRPGSSTSSRFSRPSSSGSPNFSRSGSSRPFGAKPDDEDEDSDEDKDPPTRRSPFSSGGSSPFNRPSTSSSRKPGSSGQFGSRPGGSSDDDDKDDKSPPRRSFSSGGSPSRYSGNRPGPSSSGGPSPTSRPNFGKSSSSGGSQFGSGKKPGGDGDGEKSKGRANFGSGRSGGLPGRSNINLPGRPKEPDKEPSKSEEDAKSGDDKGDTDGKSPGERLSSLRNRFSLGNKDKGGDEDKKRDNSKGKDDKDGDSGGGILAGASSALGGLTNRLPFGGGDEDKPDKDKKEEKESDKKPGRSFPSFSRKAASSEEEKADDKKDASEVKKPSSPRFGSRGGKGIKPSAKKDDAKKESAKGEKDKSDEGKGLGARVASLTASLPFVGKGDDEKPASKTVRQRSKAPKVVKGEGLSLDRKLDILGVGLVFVSGALLLSRLSENQGVLTENINHFFESLLGWGAWAVPIAMFGVGMWLIIRHFGEEPPTVDTERLIGVGVIYISLLVLFQFINALNYTNVTSFEELANLTELSWTEDLFIPSGGGWVGGNLYLLMVQYLGEILSFAVAIFAMIVGVMFLLDVSVSEIAIIVIGLWRSFRAAQRRSNQRKKVRRAERLAQRREQLAALTPPEPSIEVAKPNAEQLSAGEAVTKAASLPAPEPGRAIPITMGGRTVTTSMSGEQQSVADNTQAQTAPDDENDKGNNNRSGLLGGALASVFSLGGGQQHEAPPPESPPAVADVSETSADDAPTSPPPLGNDTAPSAPTTTAPASAGQGDHSANLFAPPPGQSNPPEAAPPTAGEAPQQEQSEASPAQKDGPLKSKRITQAMRAVGTEDAEDEPKKTEETDANTQSNGNDRMERLNAIRQGRAVHPNKNGDHQPAAPPKANGAAAEAEKPTFVAGKTDAYGNSPTPPPSMGRPDDMKPKPAAVVSSTPQQSAKRDWSLPDADELLNAGSDQDFDRQFLVEQARVIEDTLKSFGAPGRVVEINTGPVITQYGVEPDYLQSRSGKRSRVKVSAIAQLDRDLQLALGAKSIRIEAPVPGKGYVGIEIPNAENALVSLKDVMQADQFQKLQKKSPLTIALGQSVDGTPVAADLTSMPHLLIAGTTGSGKSVCINSIISSMLTNNTPEELKFIMVDPKRVELTGYNGIPHLVAPVVVELERIVGVLKWVTREMDERYKRFSGAGARNIVDFNKHLSPDDERMPYIVVIIDELADLMMLAPEETERTITRIAALARATGIHLVIATQRPSVDVVTGLIKANFPARIAFAVAGSVDSRVILDQPGAERLLGRGDMLYLSGDSPAPQRLQGVFVSDDEIENINRYWKTHSFGLSPSPTKKMAPLTLDPSSAPPQVSPSVMPGATPQQQANQPQLPMQQAFWDSSNGGSNGDYDGSEPDDELYEEAVELVRRLNKASVSLLQRRLRIGYTRASRLIDMMEERGVVGEQESGSKPREVLSE